MKFFRKLHSFYKFLILLACGGVIVLLYIFAITWLENKIESELALLHAKTSSVQVNLLSRSIILSGLELYPNDSTAFGVQLKNLSIRGISLYHLLAEKRITIREIVADSGKMSYNKSAKKGSSKRPSSGFHDLSILHLKFVNVMGEVQNDTTTEFSSMLNIHASGITVGLRSAGSFSMSAINGVFEKTKITQASAMYLLTINRFQFNSQQKEIKIDSILLIPKYGKFEFAHRKGEQVGRVSLSVPKIHIKEFNFEHKGDSSFTASRLEIQSFDLYSFKDKRVPFLRDFTIPLPMESLLKLRHMVTVDSVIIKDSRVTIEEIPENGTEGGVVTIEHINAACGRVSNRYQKGSPKFAILNASGLLMNTGEIKATFSLPLDGSPTYFTVGRISNLPFEKLNPALENLVRVRIESGKLNNMKFNFQYTDARSVGTMEIDYEDLRMIGLKKNNDDTNDLKTLLMNAIVKDNKNKSLSKLKRTGSINIERDRKRYIFNVWWKSILDGLKSSILGIENDKKSNAQKKTN